MVFKGLDMDVMKLQADPVIEFSKKLISIVTH